MIKGKKDYKGGSIGEGLFTLSTSFRIVESTLLVVAVFSIWSVLLYR